MFCFPTVASVLLLKWHLFRVWWQQHPSVNNKWIIPEWRFFNSSSYLLQKHCANTLRHQRFKFMNQVKESNQEVGLNYGCLLAFNIFPVSQVQPRAGPLLWWGLWLRQWHLCLSGNFTPTGSPPGGARLHPVWLRALHSDSGVPASRSSPVPGTAKSSRDPSGYFQARRLPGLPVHHIHHSQSRSACGPPWAGQEDGKEAGGSWWKWAKQEKRSSSHRLKINKT